MGKDLLFQGGRKHGCHQEVEAEEAKALCTRWPFRQDTWEPGPHSKGDGPKKSQQ